MRKFFIIILYLFLVVLLLKVFVLLIEDRFAFHPSAAVLTTPADVGLDYQPVEFPSGGGIKLHGWFIPGPSGAPVVLYSHGNTGNIGNCAGMVKALQELGFAWFVYDYRGFGQSGGHPGEEGLREDAASAYRECRRQFCPDPRQLVIWGYSLGTHAALSMASREPAAAIILEAPFQSAAGWVQNRTWLEILFPLSSLELDNQRLIRGCSQPKLVIHGDQDSVVPLAQARTLIRSAQPPLEFYVVAGAGHDDLKRTGGSAYRQKIQDFVRRCVRTAR